MGAKKIETMREDYVSPKILSIRYAIPRPTIYDWKYRPEKYGIPDQMFKKFGNTLKIHVVIFENWFQSRNG